MPPFEDDQNAGAPAGGESGGAERVNLDDLTIDLDGDDSPARDDGDGDDGEGEERAARAEKKKPDAKADPDRSRRAALRQERQARKQAEARAAKMEETFQQLLAKMSGEQGGAQRGRQQEIEDLEELAETQPIDAFKKLARKVKEYESGLEQQERQAREQREETQRREAAIASVTRALEDDEADFAEETPDYPQASEFYVTGRVAELEAMGVPRAQAAQAVRMEILQLTARNASMGASPAEAIYRAAQARGYKTPGASPRDKVKQMRDGQAAARSIGAGGRGGGAGTGVTLAELSNLKGEAFDRAYAKLQRQMMSR